MLSEQEEVTHKFKDLAAKFMINKRLLKVNPCEFSEQQIAEIAQRANYRIMRQICGSYPLNPMGRKMLNAK